MINADQTVMILLVAQVVGSILIYFIFKRETKNTITEIFKQPIVKGAMSVLGTKSGEVRHDEAIKDQLATQLLSSPEANLLKNVAKQMGFDVDAMVEEQGAGNVLEQVLAGAKMLNIDIFSLLEGVNRGEGAQTSDKSAYLP